MTASKSASEVVQAIRAQLDGSSSATRRLKIRTLLRRFGYNKRSDRNTAAITELLSEVGIRINPPLVRLGSEWELGLEDWIYLSVEDNASPSESGPDAGSRIPASWNVDGWFDRLGQLQLRTEKEVELKFIVPLLSKLGYSEGDRYDGMPVPAAHGSRATTLVIDFAVFNSDLVALRNQPLLTVEAKREERLTKAKEIQGAHNQAKSYCLWTQCDYFMVTDGRIVQLYQVGRGGLNALDPLFSCTNRELREEFPVLYRLASKEVLTRHYLTKLSALAEVQ